MRWAIVKKRGRQNTKEERDKKRQKIDKESVRDGETEIKTNRDKEKKGDRETERQGNRDTERQKDGRLEKE